MLRWLERTGTGDDRSGVALDLGPGDLIGELVGVAPGLMNCAWKDGDVIGRLSMCPRPAMIGASTANRGQLSPYCRSDAAASIGLVMRARCEKNSVIRIPGECDGKYGTLCMSIGVNRKWRGSARASAANVSLWS